MSDTNPAESEAVTSKALAPTNPFAVEDLRSIQTYDDAVRLLADAGVPMRDAATEIGDGFLLLKDKDELLDKPFVILHAHFAKGDFGEDFSIMRVVSASGKWIVTDGGTGIADQLRQYMIEGRTASGLVCQQGLRKSTYDTDEDGRPTTDPNQMKGKGTTYYLNV